jgi:hypothetical protein
MHVAVQLTKHTVLMSEMLKIAGRDTRKTTKHINRVTMESRLLKNHAEKNYSRTRDFIDNFGEYGINFLHTGTDGVFSDRYLG